jgi:peptidoglycan L-alanyl-D-glutamate endopeptidase CwlK
MAKFSLSSRSKKSLEGVHPDLVKVIVRALEITPTDFGVSEGLRQYSRQVELMAQGKSQTLKSRHLEQKDGFSHAVDLFIIVNGMVSWEHKDFRKVIQAVFTAAIELGVQVEAGALWRNFLDSPHIQLNKNYY